MNTVTKPATKRKRPGKLLLALATLFVNVAVILIAFIAETICIRGMDFLIACLEGLAEGQPKPEPEEPYVETPAFGSHNVGADGPECLAYMAAYGCEPDPHLPDW